VRHQNRGRVSGTNWRRIYLVEVEVALEAQDGLFEAVPHESGEADGGREANEDHGNIAWDAEAVKREVNVASDDGKDEDVGDVEAVADLPDEQQRFPGERPQVEGPARCGLTEEGGDQHSAESDSQKSVGKGRAVVKHEGDAGGSGGQCGAGYPFPCRWRPTGYAKSDGDEGTHGESVEMGEGVGGREPVAVKVAREGRGGEHECRHRDEPARGKAAGDGRPKNIELLLDGKTPGGADGSGQGDVPEVLDEQEKKYPRGGGDLVEHRSGASEYEREKPVEEEEQKPIDGPDAEEAAGEEGFIKVGRGAGVEDDSGDKESGEHEEKTDAAPSPGDEGLKERALESRMAMVKNDGKDGDAAESVKGGDEGGQPRGTHARGSRNGSGCALGGDCRRHYREIPSMGELAEA